jgi:hypothetical protein
MSDSRGTRGVGHEPRLRLFPIRRKVVPEKRDQEGTMGALECLGQPRLVIDRGADHFRPGTRQGLRPFRCGIARDGAQRKAARRIVENRPGKPPALHTRGTDHCDDLLLSHHATPHGLGQQPTDTRQTGAQGTPCTHCMPVKVLRQGCVDGDRPGFAEPPRSSETGSDPVDFSDQSMTAIASTSIK